MSSITIHPPTSSEPFGTFNNIAYVHHQGQASGFTDNGGAFSVPYEFITPVNPSQGNRVCVFEAPHLSGGPIARRVYLGARFLFNRGFSSCSIGYANVGMRILNPTPGFPLRINGQTITVIDHPGPGTVTDTNILRQFAFALKERPIPFLGTVAKTIAIGFSETGTVVHNVYHDFGHKLFDLSFACTAKYVAPVKISGQSPIIVFNSEYDFDARAVPDPAFPQYRWYTVAGAPHIPDSALTRPEFQSDNTTPVTGTSPMEWSPIMRALFVAGDQWVRNGTAPPASVTLRVNPQGIIARDVKCNALGGIRHPALENGGEATFIASVVRPHPELTSWELFAGYSDPKRLTDAEFPLYLRSFKAAAEALVTARYLLPEDRDRLIEQAQLRPPNTFTRNYMNGLFPASVNSTD